jgi:uncharacterized membrane protein YbhN (UPF0104 family)
VTRLASLVRNPWAGGVFVLASLVLAILALWWRGPDWNTVYHAFDFVSWRWVVVGVLLNLLSVLFRTWSWSLTIDQAMPPPLPRFRQVFSAFGVGLLGNAVLPARAGELARVAVLRRHLPHGKGTSATLLGTVFAHRLFDLFPIALLVAYVAATAKLPHWAVTGVVIVGLVGLGLLARTGSRRTASAPCGACSRWRARGSRCCARPVRRSRRSAARSWGGRSSSSPSGSSRRRSTSTSRSPRRLSCSCW